MKALAMWTLSKIVMLVFLFTLMASVLYYQQWVAQLNQVEQARTVTEQVREALNRALLPDSLQARFLIPLSSRIAGKQYTLRVEQGKVSGQNVVIVMFAYGAHDQAFTGPWDSATALTVSSDVTLSPPAFTVNSSAVSVELNKTVSTAGTGLSLSGCRLVTSTGECVPVE